MLEIERIQEYLQKLQAPLQTEVLDFVEYLLTKVEREAQPNDPDWSAISLASVMRGMEDENTPVCSLTVLKAAFY